MLASPSLLRGLLQAVINAKAEQGHVVEGLSEAVDRLPDHYDALVDFARRLADLPLRDDWPYREPSELDEIRAECDRARPLGAVAPVDLDESARRVEAAFLGSVCGCVLGKPLEVNPTLDEIRQALEKVGQWPLDRYISERALEALGRRHASWQDTVCGRIRYVACDDDLNYTILGMLILEENGIRFTKDDVRRRWLRHLPITQTFGPERLMLLRAGVHSLAGDAPADYEAWVSVLNPKEEYCGALIRADAYGYACPGRPALAAGLAWRDASWTHRRTGIYGAMFAAAAIATAQVSDDRLGIFETALKFVPQKSRFHHVVADSLAEVARACDWIDGYNRIHDKYGEYTHCRVFQEVGTVINTLRFAESVGDGISKQVCQGNDTDSFGATVGSLLGAYFGPGHLEARWLEPFNDEIRTSLALFYERSLSKLAGRMSRLPGLVARQLEEQAADDGTGPEGDGIRTVDPSA